MLMSILLARLRRALFVPELMIAYGIVAVMNVVVALGIWCLCRGG